MLGECKHPSSQLPVSWFLKTVTTSTAFIPRRQKFGKRIPESRLRLAQKSNVCCYWDILPLQKFHKNLSTKFVQFPLSHNGKNWNKEFLQPDYEPACHQSVITCCQSHVPPVHKISSNFVYNFLSLQPDKGRNKLLLTSSYSVLKCTKNHLQHSGWKNI